MSAPASADGNAMGIARCNRLCRLTGLVILLAATAICDSHSTLYGDFVQFYMTGLVDRGGAWDALYPVPVPGSIHNAGNILDSTQKPQADAIAAAHGVDYVPYHFILPPPAAGTSMAQRPIGSGCWFRHSPDGRLPFRQG
jgi:hypothetical protein